MIFPLYAFLALFSGYTTPRQGLERRVLENRFEQGVQVRGHASHLPFHKRFFTRKRPTEWSASGATGAALRLFPKARHYAPSGSPLALLFRRWKSFGIGAVGTVEDRQARRLLWKQPAHHFENMAGIGAGHDFTGHRRPSVSPRHQVISVLRIWYYELLLHPLFKKGDLKRKSV